MRNPGIMIKFVTLLIVALTSACSVSTTTSYQPHATTVYVLGSTLGTVGLAPYLTTNLPAIKKLGFDTIYLPAIWADLDPTPFAVPRTFNETGFTDARAALDVVRANGMKALVGLNYLGIGFAPNFGSVLPPNQVCDWAVTPAVYASFERYVAQVFTEYEGYEDVLSLMVFTEGAEGCGLATQLAAPAVALQLQTTLGSLPTRLPAAVRARWRIGYHDYSIVNLGWGNGVGPIASPNPFDFVSMVAYNVTTSTELDARAARFNALYDVPLIIGELGSSSCPAPYTTVTQATGDVLGVSWALLHGHGMNVWDYPNGGASECSAGYGGYAITDVNGNPLPAATAIGTLLGR